MSKERYNQIIDEVYENYLIKRTTANKDNIRIPHTLKNGMTGQISRQFTKEEFIHKCKTDQEFSERWGLKIEERELNLNDRILEFAKRDLDPYEFRKGGNFGLVVPEWKTLEVLNKHNIPMRAISLTYKNETIEVYI